MIKASVTQARRLALPSRRAANAAAVHGSACVLRLRLFHRKRDACATLQEMKWRNQLLALFCLLAFAGLGVLYFQHWVARKPFGIILFIGEGLAPVAWRRREHLPAGQTIV